MRWGICAVVGLVGACGFTLPTGAISGDDEVVPGREVRIVDDDATDFTGTLSDGIVATYGVIEPHAYSYGGWHARAFAGETDRATYAQTSAEVGTPMGEGYRQNPGRYDDTEGRPKGLGINRGDSYTLLYDGELKLPAGTLELELEADDVAHFELALDGQEFSTVLVDRHNTQNPKVTIAVPADGWYPIRASISESYGSAFMLMHYTPQGGSRFNIDANHTRARVTAARGLVVDGFRGRLIRESRGQTAVATTDHDFQFSSPGFDLGMPGDDFALRYQGQIRFDEPGSYAFTADASGSNDRWRVWVDQRPVAGNWASAALPGSVDIAAPGWYAYGVDFADDNFDAHIRVKLAGPGIPDAIVDPGRLRPAVTARTAIFAPNGQRQQIMDAGAAAAVTRVSLAVDAPEDATLIATDWGFDIENARMTDLTAQRIDCAATDAPLGPNPGPVYLSSDITCAGTAMPLAWAYEVTDKQNGGNQGNIANSHVVATYAGGPLPPFAETTTYVSPAHPTPGAVGFGRIVVAGSGRGRIEVALRTADSEAELASALWTVTADGEVPDIEARAVVQYRVTLASDGWQYTTLDRIEVPYIVRD